MEMIPGKVNGNVNRNGNVCMKVNENSNGDVNGNMGIKVNGNRYVYGNVNQKAIASVTYVHFSVLGTCT